MIVHAQIWKWSALIVERELDPPDFQLMLLSLTPLHSCSLVRPPTSQKSPTSLRHSNEDKIKIWTQTMAQSSKTLVLLAAVHPNPKAFCRGS